ncbi:MAG: hypothetical protein LC099_12570 [Anaerolineales bacterium]|nr:hypothetical protein [Anaerolineales bacterium]
MNLTEIGISEKLSNILTDKGHKIVRIDTNVSKGECYLKQDVRGSYEIYKAESDFSRAELLLIVEPKMPREITFIYDRFGRVQEGEYFLDTSYELLKWAGSPSKKQFHIYKKTASATHINLPSAETNEPIDVKLQFETWCASKKGYSLTKFDNKDEYLWPHVQSAWEIWQEAVAILEARDLLEDVPAVWMYEYAGEKKFLFHDPTETEKYHGFKPSIPLYEKKKN